MTIIRHDHYNITESDHYNITESDHYNITEADHYNITEADHYNITEADHYNIICSSNNVLGVKAKVAIEGLGLKEEVDMLEPDVLQKIYQERMNVVEQKCANDIHELLLERLDLFHDYTPDPKEITKKLMVSNNELWSES